jgi:hypothetical protein
MLRFQELQRPFTETMLVLTRLKPYLFLAGLTCLYFGVLAFHPTYVLYSEHSDLLATFLPVKRFLVRSWQQTGEVPLWCPYSFGGMPFIHDVQVAAFYPLHWLLYLLPEDGLGAAMSWMVVAHVFIAGCCMLAYGRSQGLESVSGLVAAVGYMFAGKWLLHVLEAGHYVLIPLAWLPLVLLWLEQAIRWRSLLYATWAGAAFALIVLGTHPQMTFYAGIFIAVWTLCLAAPRREARAERAPLQGAARLRWLVYGTWTALVAGALGAVQLLPALEAAPESTRAGGVAASDAAAVAGPALLGLVGPAWNGGWEDRGGLGLLWVAAAVAAPLWYRGQIRYQGVICLGLIAFATGGAALLQWLPGFRLFQIPVRMLVLLALPVALLAGRTTQALIGETPACAQVRDSFRRLLILVVGAGLVMTGCAAPLNYRAWQPAYWIVLVLTTAGALWLLGTKCSLNRRAWAGAWLALLLADAWGLTWTKVAVRSADEVYAPSTCVRYLTEAQQRDPQRHWRVLDRGLLGQPSSAPLGAALPMFGHIQIEPVLGYNPFDLRRYKEFLQFIMDEDNPIRPRAGIFGYPIIQGFPIRNKSLLDLLGARYTLEPDDGSSQFDAPGEPGKNTRWQRVGPEDAHPQVFSFLAGGVQPLPPYRVYENRDAFPRAFIVHQAAPLADRSHILAQMKSTDFRREVLLEGERGCVNEPRGADAPPLAEGSATIREYRPNRVVVDLQTALPGYLVLTDIWFPGWSCTMDGQSRPIQRADFLFRAVAIPAGSHEVSFVFSPASYRWGRLISMMAMIAVAGFSLLARGCNRKSCPDRPAVSPRRERGGYDGEPIKPLEGCTTPGWSQQRPTP